MVGGIPRVTHGQSVVVRQTRGLPWLPWYCCHLHGLPFSAVLMTKCLPGTPAAASALETRAPNRSSFEFESKWVLFSENPRTAATSARPRQRHGLRDRWPVGGTHVDVHTGVTQGGEHARGVADERERDSTAIRVAAREREVGLEHQRDPSGADAGREAIDPSFVAGLLDLRLDPLAGCVLPWLQAKDANLHEDIGVAAGYV